MRSTLYKDLMQHLDAAVNNGYEEFMLESEPEVVLDDLTNSVGERYYEMVSRDEMCRAIQGWQERQDEQG